MPVPYRDADDIDELGSAAYLTIRVGRSPSEWLAALFMINGRGEPIELTYNRVETESTFLWRTEDLRRYVERKLTASLLDACKTPPAIIFGLADEIGGELFSQDIALSIPVGRVGGSIVPTTEPGRAAASDSADAPGRRDHSSPTSAIDDGASPTKAETDESPVDSVHLFWHPEPPASDSRERRLFDHLATHGLLLEPFERAAAALREVYPESASSAP